MWLVWCVCGWFDSGIFYSLKLVDLPLFNFFRAVAVHLAGADFARQGLLPADREVWQFEGSCGLLRE